MTKPQPLSSDVHGDDWGETPRLNSGGVMYHIYMRSHTGNKSNKKWSRWLSCCNLGNIIAHRVGNKNGATIVSENRALYLCKHLSKHPKRGLWCEYQMRKVETNSTTEG